MKQTFTIEVTRKEFLTLPIKIRRKALRQQVNRFAKKMNELQTVPSRQAIDAATTKGTE